MQISKIIALIFLVGIFFYACEKIDPPYKIGEGESERGTSGDTVKNVLIEDYTGHACPNCPEAADYAHDLQAAYGERVVIIAVHAGYYAQTEEIFGPEFTADYRTDAGTTWNDFFGFNQVGYPNGLVDREEDGGNYVVAWANWGTAAESRLNEGFLAKITIENTYNAGTNNLTSNIKTEFQQNLNGNYSIIACITQDSIISPQKDKRVDGGLVEHYHHMHMLRSAMNGNWGENVTGGENPIAGKAYEKNYSIAFENDWVPEDCWVVAFIYDEANKTLIQVDEEKVTD